MTSNALKVGIVGAGGRVKGNYLPALRLMADDFSVSWVHARNQDSLNQAMAPWGVRTIASLSPAAIDEVDVIAVSVPPTQNAVVLRKLKDASKRLHLVIDTPVAASIGQARELWPLLRSFASVTVTEDFMNFPDFALVRKAVSDGAIGPVRSVVLDGTRRRRAHWRGAVQLLRPPWISCQSSPTGQGGSSTPLRRVSIVQVAVASGPAAATTAARARLPGPGAIVGG